MTRLGRGCAALMGWVLVVGVAVCLVVATADPDGIHSPGADSGFRWALLIVVVATGLAGGIIMTDPT
jgi:hypothetical protein